ncbi:spore germination protein [Paenibacillus sp. BC26]|uniref:spore germination protein n=1 Tax=Paenibacillus sp. BC26 TaxID=1881032 RepID=UPI0008E534B2|nr:spore germination protein [Paenibacillus sp. BC26]SFT28451.1 GerA spore germination protein [Paenibacillus sp. BC26]
MTTPKTDDWNTYHLALQERTYRIEWLSSMVDQQVMQERFLPMLQLHKPHSSEEMKRILPIANIEIKTYTDKHHYLLQGYISVTIETAGVAHPDVLYLPSKKNNYRGIEAPLEEFAESGPMEAFTESLESNVNMIRRRLMSEQLHIRNLVLGSGKLPVAILNMADNVMEADRLTYQVEQASIDHAIALLDISSFAMLLPNGTRTFFSPYDFAELPLRAVHALESGKVIMLMEGSRKALIAPTSFEDSFTTASDLFSPRYYVMLIRILRVACFIMALMLTPLYVAVSTYNFQMFPSKIIETLLVSRYRVPFSPFVEALFMEILVLIQLEAVTRLPNKLSQSAGIVAGIVLGTAAVEAGIVSNVMLVLVSISSLLTLASATVQLRGMLFFLKVPSLMLAVMLGLPGICMFWFLLLSRLFAVRSLDKPLALFGIHPLSRYIKGKG